MGRKKKKVLKPWCWYCNREFDEEKVLIYHQKAKHFKCNVCGKKLYTGPGLAIHSMQVHKQTIKSIPNSIPNRGDPDVEIYGTEGIPFKDTLERAKHMNIELDLRDRELAAAALPPKFERTLDAPYGTPTIRTIQPTSPSVPLPGTQSILKNYNTPPIGGNSSATPVDFNQVESVKPFVAFGGNEPPGVVNILPFDQSQINLPKVNIERIVPPTDRSKIYHPVENISLEEHRLRFQKYASFKPQSLIPSHPIYTIDGSTYNYNHTPFPSNADLYPPQFPNNYQMCPPIGYQGYLPPPEYMAPPNGGPGPFQPHLIQPHPMVYGGQPQFNMDMSNNAPPNNYYRQH